MIFNRVNSRILRLIAVTFLILLAAPAVYLWFTAPPDPKYNGRRLSTLLYEAWEYEPSAASLASSPGNPWDPLREALRHLEFQSAPLVAKWSEDKPGRVRTRIGRYLMRHRIRFPYFTVDHPSLVRFLKSFPESAVAFSEKMQNEILQSSSDFHVENALEYAALVNGTDLNSRKLIATRSSSFIAALLDRYEETANDSYELALVNFIIRDHPQAIPPKPKERIIRLSKNSRYLAPAATAIRQADQLQ